MKTLIIGNGEIGKSLLSIFEKEYDCTVLDIDGSSHKEFEIMHICFPYSDEFVTAVKEYQDIYKPKYTIIHSTVLIGTSRQCNSIHSPCTGIHPHLGESLTTFTKFLGGENASEVAQYFRRAGIKIYLADKQETTELMKIMCTSYYSMAIEYTKEVKRLSKENDVPFEFWTIWNNSYNEGYKKLGYPEYVRQNLVPIMTPQNGHCTIPNLEFLDSPFSKFIKEQNAN